MCNPITQPDCSVGDFLGGIGTSVAGNVAESMLNGLAKAMSDTAAWALKTLIAGWIAVPSPVLTGGPVDRLREYTYWITGAVAVFSLLVAAGRIVWERNAKAATDAGRGLLQLTLISAAGVPTVALLSEFGDGYSTWIVDASTGGDLGERLLMFAPVAGATAFNGLTSIALITIAFMLLLISFMQILLSIGIAAIKVLLSGLMPLAAAAAMTGTGRAMLARYMSWLMAALLYKPAAATVYAAAFWMIGDGKDLITVLTGIVLMCMGIVAMPALLKLLAPATSQVAMGSGGGGGMAAPGTIATGAMLLNSTRGGGGGGGGGDGQGAAVRPAGAGPGPGSAPASSGGGGAMAGGGGGAAGGGAAAAGGGVAAGGGAAAAGG
ncbi:hypothetical protein, partial [Micromonospora psammae]|uniref:hypothetical protein n=1 Tax=Micromonospora sp. CPCC 205556 TaxID=3122398 RepID=UPI002FEEB858